MNKQTKQIEVGNPPLRVGDFKSTSEEMFFYQYLPIKMKWDRLNAKVIPEQLSHLHDLIDTSAENFFRRYGRDKYLESYIYLTAKNQYAKTGENINREGWHLDGFMSDDINYIWSDSLPTEYSLDDVIVPYSHKECLEVLNNRQYDSIESCEPNTIYRIDETVIHRPSINTGIPFMRKFVKISFSKEKYNLEGNAHNYLIYYKWDMLPRGITRNHPTRKEVLYK